MENKKVKYKDYNCTVCLKKYPNKRTALQLIDQEDGCSVAMASVNLPDISIEDNEVAIKDYSENEGMLLALIKAGIISEPVRYSGSFPICTILI